MTRKSLIERILANWPAKVLSLAAAIILFFFNRLSVIKERDPPIFVPLSIVMEGEYVPSEDYKQSIKLVVRGEADKIHSVRDSDFIAEVDLSSVKQAGPVRLPVKVIKKGPALNVAPLEVRPDPEEVILQLEKSMTKYVRVVPRYRGSVAEGYYLAAGQLRPSSVEIFGPESVIGKIKDIQTEVIELTGRKSDFALEVAISSDNPLVKVLGSGKAQLSASIAAANSYKAFEGIPIHLENLAKGLLASETKATASVRLLGQQMALRDTTAESLKAVADLSAILAPGNYSVPVKLYAPSGLEAVGLEPEEIQVLVTRDASRDAQREDDR